MKILLLGDTHGNKEAILYAFKQASEHKADGIVQLGDFGFWTHTAKGSEFIKVVDNLVRSSGRFFWWLDGNHENFNNLYEFYPIDEDTGLRPITVGSKNHKPYDKKYPVAHPFAHLPRGFIWEWDGVRFCAFGGAYSIDKYERLKWEAKAHSPGLYWWPQEKITEAELIRFEGSNPKPVDIFLSHDCPYGVDIPCLRAQVKDDFPESTHNRKMLAAAVDLVMPKTLLHGHYHEAYVGVYEGPRSDCDVFGLDCDGTGRLSWALLDCEEYAKHHRLTI